MLIYNNNLRTIKRIKNISTINNNKIKMKKDKSKNYPLAFFKNKKKKNYRYLNVKYMKLEQD